MKSSPARSKAGSAGRGAPAPRARRAAPGGGLAILERCDAGDFPSSLYLEGPSEALKAAFLVELRAAWNASAADAAPPQVMRAPESGIEPILAAWQSASLFSSRELVIVFDVEGLGRNEKKIAALAAGLAAPGSASSLVLVESEAEDTRKSLEPLRAACHAHWIALPPSRTELLAWAERRWKRERITSEPGVIETIVEACEGDALAFFSELSKLATFAAGGTLDGQQVRELLRPVVGADLNDYLGAVASGYPGLAAQRLGRLLAAGVGEGQIMFALGNMVGGALGGWSKFKEHSMALRRRRPPRDLALAMDAIYRAESAWKSGRADAIAALEQATRTVAG